MNITRTNLPYHEPLSLNDVKTHLRVVGTDDDDFFRQAIPSVRDAVERYCNMAMITSHYEVTLDAFEDEIQLPRPPILTISSLQYYDTDNSFQTLSVLNYEYDSTGRLRPSYGNVWPETRDRYEAVKVTYRAGYANAGQVPDDIKLAMLLFIGEYDLNREDSSFVQQFKIPARAKDLLQPYRKEQL